MSCCELREGVPVRDPGAPQDPVAGYCDGDKGKNPKEFPKPEIKLRQYS